MESSFPVCIETIIQIKERETKFFNRDLLRWIVVVN